MLARDAIERWGDNAMETLDYKALNEQEAWSRFTPVNVCIYSDYEWDLVWFEGYQRPVIQAKKDFPLIPYVCHLVEGSYTAEKQEDKRKPFLYNYWKSGLWGKMNMTLTVLYTNIFTLGALPVMVMVALCVPRPSEVVV